MSTDIPASELEPAVTSEKFSAPDADVVFKSCDNVLFHIHRRNLEAHAGAFPPAEIETKGEVVRLTEDSSTLEHLFDYVYPRRHSIVNTLAAENLFKLAVAAEKYEVFTLMEMCHIRIKQIIDENPEQALLYGYMHEYIDVMDQAAPLLLGIPIDEFVGTLPLGLVIPWVRYRKNWGRAANKAISTITSSRNDLADFEPAPYNGWHQTIESPPIRRPQLPKTIGFDQNLSRKSLFALLNCLARSQENLHDNCTECNQLEKALKEVPKFSTFLSSK